MKKRGFFAGSFALVALAVVVASSSCKPNKASQGQTCGSTKDCADGLQCLIVGITFTCVTEDQAAKACAASAACKQDGRCSAHNDTGLGNVSCQKTK